MTSDRSRPPDDGRDHYTGVVMQQGRVIVDRDFNAVREILDQRTEREVLDIVGPCGTPDNGFAISLASGSPPPSSPPLWLPPPPLSPPRAEPFDFLIAPGTMYVGGERIDFPERQAGGLVTYSYFDQPDLIARAPWIGSFEQRLEQVLPGRETVYLHIAEQEVGAVEDPDLLDAALGGPDTTGRLRLMRTVRRQGVGGADCAGAWAEATARWQRERGLVFDARTMRLLPQARLQVGFTQAVTSADPCDPVATGGYLGADNQLIRVQIADPGSTGRASRQAQLLWGYDNASFVYRVASIDATGKRLQLTQDPPDAFHMPQTGQAVEVLRTAAILGSEPDETDPTRQRTIVRCIADHEGFVTVLDQPYDPTSTAKALVLHDALPAEYAQDPYPLFVRVWQGLATLAPAGGTVELIDPVSKATTGVEVTLSVAAGSALTRGAFWMMALRPSTPQSVYPERLLAAPQPPTGPRLWACPLAVIDWTASLPTVNDCRQQFDNLVDLTRRGSCCTVSVRPEDLTEGISLQSVLDHAATLVPAVSVGQAVTVCLAAGLYVLEEPLRLDSRHSHLAIEGCGGVAALTGTGPSFADGLVVLTGAQDVTLRGLALAPQPVSVSQALFEPLLAGLPRSVMVQEQPQIGPLLKQLEAHFNLRLMLGVRAVGSASLTLDRCYVSLDTHITEQDNLFGIGLHATGECSGLTVRDCQFVAGFTPTATPGITQPDLLTARFEAPGQSRVGFQGAVGCLVSPFVKAFPSPNADHVEQFTLPALLQDGTFSGNSFQRMTVAVAVLAEIGTFRTHANSVLDSVSGFWIKTSERRAFEFRTGQDLTWDDDSTWLRLALATQESFLLFVLGLAYPLPQGAGTTVPQPLAGPASIFIAENHVAALPPDATRAPAGGLALAVLTGTGAAANPPDQGAALVISANRFQGRAAAPYPTVLLVYDARCAVTGNAISVSSPFNGTPASLFILPNAGVQPGRGAVEAAKLVVSGNVLEGRSNLDTLIRTDVTTPLLVPPFNTWLPFNASA